ncbi:MAG TPA: GAF domain-containing protein, partial [Cyanophyceae cyanobacterium]
MKSQETSKPKLLVVDDEPDNLDLLYRTFHRDYKVLRAENGPDALEILAKEGDVAVIISDQRMPLMSGTEFLSLTATRYPDIIRIILTGYTDVEDLVEAINSGKVFKYVTKPWNAEDLKGVVRQALDTHNVLKVRTQELCRALRRESLLNTVTNTIRNAQYGRGDGSPLQQVLQRIVETVGHLLEVDICILRPFQENRLLDEWFAYQKSENNLETSISSDRISSPSPLEQTVWETHDVEVINDVLTDERFGGKGTSSAEGTEGQTQANTETGDNENNSIPHSASPPNPSNTARHADKLSAYQQLNIRSSLVVPLISQKELVAVLALHQCGELYVWENDEIQLVVMVADQAALALSQARAYEQLHALVTQQSLINTINTAIRSSL